MNDVQLYPTVPAARARAVARDVLAVVLLLLCVALGRYVHDTVSQLNELSRGVQVAGASIEDGFQGAGERLDGVPVVGDEVSEALEDAGSRSGGRVQRAGVRSEERVDHVASVLGWLIGGLAALMVLSRLVTPRVAQIQSLTAARRALRGVGGAAGLDVEAARRAAYALPFATLLRYTDDPLGDLAAGRHEALVRCLCEESGLRVRI